MTIYILINTLLRPSATTPNLWEELKETKKFPTESAGNKFFVIYLSTIALVEKLYNKRVFKACEVRKTAVYFA